MRPGTAAGGQLREEPHGQPCPAPQSDSYAALAGVKLCGVFGAVGVVVDTAPRGKLQ